MDLQWMDASKLKLHVHLDDRETLGSLVGPGDFQVVRGSTEFELVETLDPQVEIHDAVKPTNPITLKEFEAEEKQAEKDEQAREKARAEAKAAAEKAAAGRKQAAPAGAGHKPAA